MSEVIKTLLALKKKEEFEIKPGMIVIITWKSGKVLMGLVRSASPNGAFFFHSFGEICFSLDVLRRNNKLYFNDPDIVSVEYPTNPVQLKDDYLNIKKHVTISNKVRFYGYIEAGWIVKCVFNGEGTLYKFTGKVVCEDVGPRSTSMVRVFVADDSKDKKIPIGLGFKVPNEPGYLYNNGELYRNGFNSLPVLISDSET